MDNIEEILRALAGGDDENSGCCDENAADNECGSDNGGIFGGLDPSVLLGLMSAFECMNKQDDNERLLLALKPLLREENRGKIDTAVKFLKLFAMLPILKDSGLLNGLL